MPDIAKLLWPKSVAIIGASSDTRGLRGRIVQILRRHPYKGAVYPVSRSETEVQGLKAYNSVADLPPTDLACMIIPAKFVPQELENCGKAGIKAAIIPLRPALPRRKARPGRRCRKRFQAIAKKYDMAVSGPNGEGFANTAAALCPTFSPAMDPGDVPLLPAPDRTRGQVAGDLAERRHGFSHSSITGVQRTSRSATSSPPATKPASKRAASPSLSSTKARPT
jgi:acetyltransferase